AMRERAAVSRRGTLRSYGRAPPVASTRFTCSVVVTHVSPASLIRPPGVDHGQIIRLLGTLVDDARVIVLRVLRCRCAVGAGGRRRGRGRSRLRERARTPP